MTTDLTTAIATDILEALNNNCNGTELGGGNVTDDYIREDDIPDIADEAIENIKDNKDITIIYKGSPPMRTADEILVDEIHEANPTEEMKKAWKKFKKEQE